MSEITIRFLNESLEREIYDNVITKTFPAMYEQDKNILQKYLISVIDVISSLYRFNSLAHIYQLRQNNYQDLKWILQFLLPFIPDANGKLKTITQLNDIYVSKVTNIDINKDTPIYRYSNLQYGRCKRNEYASEIEFSEEHIAHNYKLLIDSLLQSSNKLYVNWIDVLPVTEEDYQTTDLFINTYELYKSKKYIDFNVENIDPLDKSTQYYEFLISHGGSLFIGDIYNTLRNYLYDDIKDVKWLIYDISLSDNLLPLIYVLKIFTDNYSKNIIEKALNNDIWESLLPQERNKFQNFWNDLKDFSDQNIPLNIEYVFDGTSLRRIIKSIIISFDNKYFKQNKKKIEGSGYKSFSKGNTNEDEYQEDDDIEKRNLTYEDVKISIDTVKPSYIYDFIRYSLQIFKMTYYTTDILDKTKTTFSDKIVDSGFIAGIKLTHKNIYNFAKSICHTNENGEFKLLPKHWISLEKNHRDIFINRINRGDINWFNIPNYIQYAYEGEPVNTVNRTILGAIYSMLIETIFITLIKKGVLSEFAPNKNLTDLTLCPRDKVNEKITVFNKKGKYWNSAYYYLTEKPYSECGKYLLETKNGKVEEVDFFIMNEKLRPWYSAYALDWVSQIGFCHHFVNNRVTYITGGTGVGKSTQVPKLFMYFLKAIDYNSKGKVVCSQPRTAPTRNNAMQVAKELGLPISTKDKNHTDNYYVQMKFKDAEDKVHVKKAYHLSLKYITDGSLIQEFKNPVLKETETKRGVIEKYKDANLYDVIIIDEAHEHNKNMDLLLTALKTPTYYNNSLRTVILSATMDEDEPTYRRYYRDINDNRKYPLNTIVSSVGLDRINVDRRYHISPPGATTNYKVAEIYLPDTEVIQIVDRIVREGLTGDILIFQAGQSEIVKLILALNKMLPSDIIAIPYYSTMSDYRKTYVEKIHENIKNLRISKTDDFATVESYSKGTGSYRNFILVATNIAEASITIPTLKYVIETGTQKTNRYDYRKKGFILELTDISESSRLQRKGRVGRTASGTVYYTYKMGKMTDNKTQYKIYLENIDLDLFTKLKDDPNEMPIIDIDEDPNNLNNISRGNFKLNKKNKDLYKVFEKQYYTSDKYYTYVGNKEHYDYDNSEEQPKIYELLKYDMSTLIDESGTFYIVHPNELDIKRDIMGRIIGSTTNEVKIKKEVNKNYGILISNKMLSFVDDMIKMRYLSINNNLIVKTEFGRYCVDILQNLQIENPNHGKALATSLLFNSDSDVAKIIALLKTINDDIRNLFQVDKLTNRFDLKLITKNKSSEMSDILKLNEICKDLDVFVSKKIKDKFDNSIKKVSIKYNLDESLVMKLINENINNFTHNDDDTKIIRDRLMYEILIDVFDTKEVNDIIDEFCASRGFNNQIFKRYINQYIYMQDTIRKIMNPADEDKDFRDFIKRKQNEIKSILTDENERILMAFLLGTPFNIAINVLPTDLYMSVYSPTLNNVYGISSLLPFKYIPKTFVDSAHLRGILHFMSINIDTNTMGMLSYVPKKYFRYLRSIYGSDKIKKTIDATKSKHEISSYVSTKMKEEKISPNDYKLLAHMDSVLDEIQTLTDGISQIDLL